MKRKVLPDQIETRYVTKGVFFTHKQQVWIVKLAYTYMFRGKVYTIYDDTPPFDFESQDEAVTFMRKRAGRWPIKVWVNPSNPKKATAFLEYRPWIWIRVGTAGAVAGLIWLLLAALSGGGSGKPAPPSKEPTGPGSRGRRARGPGDPRQQPPV